MKVTLILPWKMVREYDSGIRLEKVHKPDWYYLGKTYMTVTGTTQENNVPR